MGDEAVSAERGDGRKAEQMNGRHAGRHCPCTPREARLVRPGQCSSGALLHVSAE
jgi:hypothetical protein